jgi:hypothetical protein
MRKLILSILMLFVISCGGLVTNSANLSDAEFKDTCIHNIKIKRDEYLPVASTYSLYIDKNGVVHPQYPTVGINRMVAGLLSDGFNAYTLACKELAPTSMPVLIFSTALVKIKSLEDYVLVP